MALKSRGAKSNETPEIYGKVFHVERNPYGYQHNNNELPKMAPVLATAFGYDEFKVQRERLTTEIVIIRPTAMWRRVRRKDSTWRGIRRGMSRRRMRWLRPQRPLRHPSARTLTGLFFLNWSGRWREMRPDWIILVSAPTK